MTREPLRLISDNVVSNDLTECLHDLMKEARAGRLTGLAFVGIMGKNGYIADTAGEAHRSPTWTRGALRSLDDKLAARIQSQMKKRRTGSDH